MYEKETIVHIVAYIKAKIAEAELQKIDCGHPKDAITQERYMNACFRYDALRDVLSELEGYYGQELK
jgi:hypothetical protein